VWKNHDVSRQRLGSAFDTIVEILRGHEATNHLTLTLS
jgi:hypothetical protein